MNDPVGKVEKPNPPAPLRAREGGAFQPLPEAGRGWGGVRSRSDFTNSIMNVGAGFTNYL
jgi:hypothetical protein